MLDYSHFEMLNHACFSAVGPGGIYFSQRFNCKSKGKEKQKASRFMGFRTGNTSHVDIYDSSGGFLMHLKRD